MVKQMNKIEVQILHEGHHNPEGLMMFLAKLTQRGHAITSMAELVKLYKESVDKTDWKSAKEIARMNHGTIKRCAPVMIAIVGASRRFLAQIRTHSVGLTFVSASLQYSDYSNEGQFCVPYEIMDKYAANGDDSNLTMFTESCKNSMEVYKKLVENGISNDTAGYAAPQALRNILIISGNHEAWDTLINKRTCRRNTAESAYVTALIWDALFKSTQGDTFFKFSGPDCVNRMCREGKMSCSKPYSTVQLTLHGNPAQNLIDETWPLMKEMKTW